MRSLDSLQPIMNLRMPRRQFLLPQILKLETNDLTMNLMLIMHPLHGLPDLLRIATAPIAQLRVVARMSDGAEVFRRILSAKVVRWCVEAHGLFLANAGLSHGDESAGPTAR